MNTTAFIMARTWLRVQCSWNDQKSQDAYCGSCNHRVVSYTAKNSEEISI